jgi:hypothetical protein
MRIGRELEERETNPLVRADTRGTERPKIFFEQSKPIFGATHGW